MPKLFPRPPGRLTNPLLLTPPLSAGCRAQKSATGMSSSLMLICCVVFEMPLRFWIFWTTCNFIDQQRLRRDWKTPGKVEGRPLFEQILKALLSKEEQPPR